jgi:5'-deoxynucleotidase
MRNTQPENIQEHSLQVAMIAHALAVIKNKYFSGNLNADRIAVLGMFHDANEIITGDLPTPIKYHNPELSKAYKDIEAVSKNKLLSMLPEELKQSYADILIVEQDEAANHRIIKSADRICAYIKCLEEEKAGNAEFKKAKQAIYKTIVDINEPEVHYFIEHFLPSYELTLDEID